MAAKHIECGLDSRHSVRGCHFLRQGKEALLQFARFLKAVISRLEFVAPNFHMVLHTIPNLHAKFDRTGHWRTLLEDFHWHFELVPVLQSAPSSYFLKDVYYNSVPPERAAEELRKVKVEQLVQS